MKLRKLMAILCVAILISLPTLTFAKGKPPKDDPPKELKVFRADLSMEVSGSVWTLPNNESADPSNIQWNGNGGNLIAFSLGDDFRDGPYGTSDGNVCFPDIIYGGSLQVYDKTSSRKDTDLVARYWFIAHNDQGVLGSQYVIDMFDDGGGWWVENPLDSAVFPPEQVGDLIYRNVTRWEMRVPGKRDRSACVTGGIIDELSVIVAIALERVGVCENPSVGCP